MSDLHAEANHDGLDSVSSTLDLASNAVRQGALDARQAAEKTWSATSLFVSRFVYTTCYTVSYGVVFPATMLSKAIPRDNAAVRGIVDGARAAFGRLDGTDAAVDMPVISAG